MAWGRDTTAETRVAGMVRLRLDRRGFLMAAAAAPLGACSAVPADIHDPGFPSYRVRDPLAGYFDLAERRAFVQPAQDPVLIKTRAKLDRPPTCDEALAIPVQAGTITLPTFYDDNAGWRKAVKPFWAIENAVSKLAGANLVSPGAGHADCLLRVLLQWARHDAMTAFTLTGENKQGWFQIEATLFAMALALAAVRPDVLHREAELAEIDAWLERAARIHFAEPGFEGGTCCNNHYYRRVVYATMIGVLTSQDDLFQSGIRAIYSALEEATPEGALPLEMKRGEMAAHYQNYAVMYLAMIAQIVERQGYPVWSLSLDGTSLHHLVRFNNAILADPDVVTRFSGASHVKLKYWDDPQYFAWFEMYLAQFPNPAMEAWIAPRRPLYNRSLGGPLTAYFYRGAQAHRSRPQPDPAANPWRTLRRGRTYHFDQ